MSASAIQGNHNNTQETKQLQTIFANILVST